MFASCAQAFRWDRPTQLAGLVTLGDVAVSFLVAEEGGWSAAFGSRCLLVLGWLAVALRHRRPVPCAAAVLAAGTVFYPMASVDGVSPLLHFVIVLYTAARAGHLVAAVALVAASMLLIGWGEFSLAHQDGRREVDNIALVLISGWFLSAVSFGHAARVRQAYMREAEERVRAAERERDVRARQSAIEERLRIARELHDVLGHSISLINVQAAAAVHRSAKRPGETEELVGALESVRATSKDALRELRATLGVLRQVDEEAPTDPAPAGLERIGELADRAAATGLDVRCRTTGEPPPVPPQISLAAYRIVQESLTNVTRHARATRADIRLAFAPGELRVDVTDDGRGAAPGPGAPGSGIAGMRERARALGGDLTAAGTGSGFRVAARLPLPLPAGPAGTAAPDAPGAARPARAPGATLTRP
ncbi:sensor histidine kinase [Streptomyces marincola]|nr:sensor histidine kinase [Streptomyces marincola]